MLTFTFYFVHPYTMNVLNYAEMRVCFNQGSKPSGILRIFTSKLH